MLRPYLKKATKITPLPTWHRALSCFTIAGSEITLISVSYQRGWPTNGSKDATKSNNVQLPTAMAQSRRLVRNPLNTIHSPRREQMVVGGVSHEGSNQLPWRQHSTPCTRTVADAALPSLVPRQGKFFGRGICLGENQ